MKKFFSLMLFVALGVSAWAEGDGNYYYFYDEVKATPTGKGVIYATDPDNSYAEPTNEDYVSETEVKHMVAGFPTSSIYVWAKPADGYQFAGWYDANNEKVASGMNSSISVSTEQVTESEPLSEDDYNYGFEPDATYYGVFSKVVVDYAAGQDDQELVGTLAISKLANDTGDNITITATPANDNVKFDYWTDSKGNKITDNPYSFTVSGVETYTAHFSGDNIITFDFGEGGKYIPFSSSLSGKMGSGMTAYRVVPVTNTFEDAEGNVISFDQTENAWGYSIEEYDDNWNLISSEFVKYEGEIPTFEKSYELSSYSAYTAGEGVLLTGKGEQSLVLYEAEYAYPVDNFLVGTVDGAVNIQDLPATDEEGNALNYYTFDGSSFVKATSGTVAQGECYLVLDATQYPLNETIAVKVKGDLDGDGRVSVADITKLIEVYKQSK